MSLNCQVISKKTNGRMIEGMAVAVGSWQWQWQRRIYRGGEMMAGAGSESSSWAPSGFEATGLAYGTLFHAVMHTTTARSLDSSLW